jgi:hypothetical protein
MLRHEEITTVNATYRHKEEGRTSTNGRHSLHGFYKQPERSALMK